MYLNVEGIKKLIPHRHPMLLLDRVTDFDPEKQMLNAELKIEIEHCEGHFPGNDIFPGALILESLFQASGVLIALLSQPEIANEERPLGFIRRIKEVKFSQTIIPGNHLCLEVRLINARPLVAKFSGKAFVGDKEVASIEEWTVAIIKEK